MRLFQRLILGLLVTAPLLAGGCKSSPPKQPAYVIPVKIWVVFANLGNEQLGRRQNRGCRLTAGEIKQYIDALNNNANVFGVSVKFQPELDESENFVLNIVNDPSIPLFGSRRTDPTLFVQNVVLGGNWTANVYNIYFTGFVSPDGFEGIGATLDPGNPSGLEHFTFFNDRGADNPSTVIVNLSDHSFEHEATHFLLRRETQGAPYNPEGHVPNGSQNILTESPPHPLAIPRGPGSEQEEIANRIRNNGVFSP